MDLIEWAQRWNVSPQAVAELQSVFNTAATAPRVTGATTEAGVMNIVRLEASRAGTRLWRNNVGAAYAKTGAIIRYGLANESPQMNKTLKSADLIGIRPVTVTPAMVGYTIGQFVSREVKAPGWVYTGTEREKAQLAWAQLITLLGGNACFAAGEGTL